MKQLFITVLLATASIFNTAKATDNIALPEVLANFQSTYSHATEVSWSTMGELYKVNFILDGKAASAFYNADGSWVAVTQNLSSLELPKELKASLKKELKDGYISDLFMMSSSEGLTYYVTVENADTKLVMKSSNGKKWSVFQKTAKI
jgi:hypothetical protein